MRVGFIGLGNVGSKLAGNLLRNGFELMVRDLDQDVVQPFLDSGASWAESPRENGRISGCVNYMFAESCNLRRGDGRT